MTRRLVIIGAGGFGREAIDVARASSEHTGDEDHDLIGVVDDSPSPENLRRLQALGVPYLGTIRDFLDSGDDAHFVIGVGSPEARQRIAAVMENAGATAATLIHPTARLGSVAVVGPGSVICSGAQVSTNVRIGAHVHLNPQATIGHDSVLDSFVSINPGAIISGDVHVHGTTLIGAGAVVLQGLVIGSGSTVGAAACVVRNVAAGATVKGVPAQ